MKNPSPARIPLVRIHRGSDIFDGALCYFRRGFSFDVFQGISREDGQHPQQHVVLIHGLLMRSHSMRWLSERLSECGMQCFCYDYPTSELGIFRHGEILREKLRALFSIIPKEEKIYFVTHSMGGILLRIALSGFTEEELAGIEAVVMLAPPNRGSYWPERIRKVFPWANRFNRCLGDLRHTKDSPLFEIPLPISPFPKLLIVKGLRDIKVDPAFLSLPGVDAPIVSADCGHAALRHSREALKHIKSFFSR